MPGLLVVTPGQVKELRRLADESEGESWDERFWIEGVRKILGLDMYLAWYRLVVRRESNCR